MPPQEQQEEEKLELTNFKLPRPSKAEHRVPPPLHTPKKPESLEDLYYYYPDIGNGEYRLRIERTQPKSYGGASVSGFICDIDEQISLEDFRNRYGGNKYNVSVIGPVKDGEKLDANGKIPMRVLASVDVVVPGPPAMGSFPNGEDVMSTRMPMYGEAPNVQAKRLEIEARAAERREEEMRSLRDQAAVGRAPEHVVHALSSQYEKAQDNMRSMADQQILVLRDQQKVLLDEISKKDEELKSLRAELINAKSAGLESARNAEIALERRLFTQHQNEIASLKDQFGRELNQLKDTNKRDIEQLEKANKERVHELQLRYAEDLTRRHTDAMTERERLVRESERSEKSLKDTYEARINDLVRTTERELATVRDQRDREINAMRTTYDSSEKFVKQTSEVRLATLGDEINRLRLEYDAAKRENDALRKQVHKDPMTFIRETKEFASEVLEWGPQQPEKAEEEETGDWKKGLFKALFKAAEKLPETAEKVTEQIATIRQQNQHQQVVAQQQAVAVQQQQQQRALAMRRRAMPPPWNANTQVSPGGAPSFSGPVQGADVPFNPPIPSRAPAPISAPEPSMQAAPPPPAPVAAPVQPPPQPPPQADPVSGPPMDATQEQQASSANEQAFERFVDELEKVIRDDVVPPAMFARAFVEQVGFQQSALLLQQISADMFLDMAEKQGKGAAITTRDGKQYVRAVWQEVGNILTQMQQAGAS